MSTLISNGSFKSSDNFSNFDFTAQVTEVQLKYKNRIKPQDRLRIDSSRKCFHLFRSVWDQDKIELVEEFKILLLNRKNEVLGITTICTGGITDCLVDIRLVFVTALKANSTSIILSHNHPSGDVTPSEQDKNLTKRIVEAGNLLAITVLDHVIVTSDSYFSFADEGLL